MEMTAKLRYLRMSPRKVRLVAGLVRGMDAGRAALALKHLPKRAARPLEKLLASARANASHNFRIEEGLYVKEIRVDEGPMLKRFRPRARGTAAPIRKRMSHVTLVLAPRGTAETVKEKKAKKI